jgi:hypothetical protein
VVRLALRCASAAALVLVALIVSPCVAVNDIAGNLIVVNDNGA